MRKEANTAIAAPVRRVYFRYQRWEFRRLVTMPMPTVAKMPTQITRPGKKVKIPKPRSTQTPMVKISDARNNCELKIFIVVVVVVVIAVSRRLG